MIFYILMLIGFINSDLSNASVFSSEKIYLDVDSLSWGKLEFQFLIFDKESPNLHRQIQLQLLSIFLMLLHTFHLKYIV